MTGFPSSLPFCFLFLGSRWFEISSQVSAHLATKKKQMNTFFCYIEFISIHRLHMATVRIYHISLPPPSLLLPESNTSQSLSPQQCLILYSIHPKNQPRKFLKSTRQNLTSPFQAQEGIIPDRRIKHQYNKAST